MHKPSRPAEGAVGCALLDFAPFCDYTTNGAGPHQKGLVLVHVRLIITSRFLWRSPSLSRVIPRPIPLSTYAVSEVKRVTQRDRLFRCSVSLLDEEFVCCLQSPITGRSRGRLPVGLGSLNRIPVPQLSLSVSLSVNPSQYILDKPLSLSLSLSLSLKPSIIGHHPHRDGRHPYREEPFFRFCFLRQTEMGRMESSRGRFALPVAVLLLLLLTSISGGSSDTLETDGAPLAVAAYLPEWRYEGANWDTVCNYTTHLILFSLEVAADGDIKALDRVPRPELLALARSAATKHGTALLICFGGNGRSDGFSPMVRNKASRAAFIRNLVALCDKHDFDGVDYNWEYPGYSFRGGYKAQSEIEEDYHGLVALLRETRQAFRQSSRVITMAYYPDQKQETLLAAGGAHEHVDLMHMMTYDQNGPHHSTFAFAKKSAKQGIAIIGAQKLTLGLPFYGRHSLTGDWTTYEDLVQKYHPLAPGLERVPDTAGLSILWLPWHLATSPLAHDWPNVRASMLMHEFAQEGSTSVLMGPA